MKTAEEWFEENSLKLRDGTLIPVVSKETIKQIQLDAYKSGMTEAAEIADKHYEDQNFNAIYRWAGYQINTTILSARDRKKNL